MTLRPSMSERGNAYCDDADHRKRYEKRYAAGKLAAQLGKSKDSCPYKSEDAVGAWLAGWSSVRGR